MQGNISGEITLTKRVDLGALKRRESLRNRAAIYRRMLEVPGIKQTELCAELKLSPGTVSAHVKQIRNGWRPAGESEGSNG